MKTYKVIATSWGGTEHTVLEGLTEKDAIEFCNDNNWELDLGYIWDLEIEEE